ncbi:MAG: anhydro-N-acetylmuramic acid kinase [Bacteroidota bacterium]
MTTKFYTVVGAMAGSSMDGLDLAIVTFKNIPEESPWVFEVTASKTVSYPKKIHNSLENATELAIEALQVLDHQFGEWIANQIDSFIDSKQIDLLGVHGHTVIHRPSDGISWQLGSGNTIAKTTGIPTVTDFRIKDIFHGGQGAPLVPMGDFMLFSDFDACLNLGGIANISLRKNQTAWDICPCNQVLNYFSAKLGKPFDAGGNLARNGKMDEHFFEQLSTLNFFTMKPPKSLPNGFITKDLLDQIVPMDGLHSYIHFIISQISKSLSKSSAKNLLVTGGGAFNTYLIETLKKELTEIEVVIPHPEIINFKEAIIFGFLALLRKKEETNVLASVTGASKDTCSGVIHLPND